MQNKEITKDYLVSIYDEFEIQQSIRPQLTYWLEGLMITDIAELHRNLTRGVGSGLYSAIKFIVELSRSQPQYVGLEIGLHTVLEKIIDDFKLEGVSS